jgi:transcription elongation factor GreA
LHFKQGKFEGQKRFGKISFVPQNLPRAAAGSAQRVFLKFKNLTGFLKLIIMSKYVYLTQEGYDRINKELTHLKTIERQKASAAIAEAREKGDLSENAEYDAAKDAQGMLEMKINELEMSIANARIIDESLLDTSEARLLCNVTIKNKTNGAKLTYKLVSEAEADLRAKKISIDSPMGKGLLGKKLGETAVVTTPRGDLQFEIVDISL